MKTNHQRGFVDRGWTPRWFDITSRLTGRFACAEDTPSYGGHRAYAGQRRGAKRFIARGDRRVRKRPVVAEVD